MSESILDGAHFGVKVVGFAVELEGVLKGIGSRVIHAQARETASWQNNRCGYFEAFGRHARNRAQYTNICLVH